MTKEQIKAEFNRWIDAERPRVWVKYKIKGEWYIAQTPSWNSKYHYIVDDEQAELRKLQIDKSDTKFQIEFIKRWIGCVPDWVPGIKYRVKPSSPEWYEDPEMKGKFMKVRDNTDNKWYVVKFERYINGVPYQFVDEHGEFWKYAEPINADACY